MRLAAEKVGSAPSASPANVFQRVALVGAVAHAGLLPITHAGMQIALGVAVVGVVGIVLRGGGRWPQGPVVWAALLLAGAAALSVPIAAATGSPPVDWRKSTSWWGLLSPIVLIAALQLGRWRDDDSAERNVMRALVAWSVGALVTSAVAWLQYVFAFDPVYAAGLRSAPVIAEAPLTPGHYAAVGFFRWYTALAHNLMAPLAVVYAIVLGARVARRSRILFAAAALAGSTAVVLTVSRAAWAAVLVALVLVVVLLGHSWRRAALITAAICVAMALHPGVRSRVAGLRSPQAISDRGVTWEVCGAMIRDRPLLGWGWGNIPARSEPYWARIAPEFPLHAWCHNSTLTGWAEGGPLLAFAVLAYWVLPAVGFWRRRGRSQMAHAAAAGGLAALGAMFVNGSLHDIFRSGETVLGFGFALAVSWVLVAGSDASDAGITPAGTRSPGRSRRADRG